MDKEVARLFVKAQRIVVEVEAMKAENEYRAQYEHESQAYSEDCFNIKAAELAQIERDLGDI